MELILTWLWQGSALALSVAIALRVRPVRAAATRYLLWWAVLAAILMLPWAGMLPLLLAPTTGVLGVQSPGGATASSAPGLLTVATPPAWLLTLGVAGWLGLVAVRLVGVARGMDHLRRLRRRCRPMRPELERTLTRWMALRADGRRTRLRVSDAVVVPSLLGLGRPLIVLPRPLVDALTADELDHVVVHEYAHAQRWDDWALLLQSVVTALVGLHPGVRIVTRALDHERELACDDWVIAQGGCPRVYALSVTKVAELTLAGTGPALAPGMARSRGEITRRVERLLDPIWSGTIRPSRLGLSVAVGALSVVIVLLGGLPPAVTTARPNGLVEESGPLAPEAAPQASVRNERVRLTTVVPSPTLSLAVGVGARPTTAIAPNHDAPTDRARWEAPRALDEPSSPVQRIPRGAPVRPGVLDARAPLLAAVPLVSRTTPAVWWAPLTSRPIVQRQTAGVLEVRGPPPARSPWQKIADGGKAIGSKATHGGRAIGSKVTEAGKATAGAVTRFGSAIARAFGGGP